jgi:thiamine biosynthesis lipoprotein ApbE
LVVFVTAVIELFATADAYVTAAFGIGAVAGPHWTARLHGYAARTILEDGTVRSTGAFPHD